MNKLIILGIIGVVFLIGASTALFMNRPESQDPIVTNEDIGDTDTDTTTEGEDEDTGDTSEEGGSISQTRTEDAKIKAAPTYSVEFNTAIANARAASSNKNYSLAISYYREALAIKNADVIHADLYALFLQINEPVLAKESVLRAIELNPSYTEYWKWLLILEKERFNAPFAELKAIYNDGYTKANSDTKVNLVTYFARMAGDMGESEEAIAQWELAIELYPTKEAIYREEINRLK